ncbi:MAG: hypothetical protein QY322_01670 [bacterium]|nr:MAG: hypothetical protein QY322_01670 [bacterium]
MKRFDFLFVLKSFIVWRVLVTLVAMFSVYYVPLFGENFFGGKLVNYLQNPLFWGWANFDGEHFTSIALYGYKSLQQFYFPFYPFLIDLIGSLFGRELYIYVWSGILISNLSLFLGLIGLYKLVSLDYSERIAKLSIILMLVFPTSFYFAAVYTESLFLCLAVWSFYLFRKNKVLFASLLGMLASGTRAVGITLLPVFLINVFLDRKLINKRLLSLLFIPLGLLAYMYYIFLYWGGSIKLYQAYTLFGEQRSDSIILLPQVFYRYVAKIIPNLSWSYPPVVFTVLLEFGIALLFLIVILYSFRKIRWDYWLFSVFGYLIPTVSGSFSSLPRYALLLFPMFIFASILLEKSNKYLRLGIYVFLAIMGTLAEILFFRGYFVS